MALGIMSAMVEEIDALIGALDPGVVHHEVGRRTYHVGTMRGAPVVLVFSRIGKVAAASTATELISRFKIERLIFTGVAGALSAELAVGDVVVATSLTQHDMDASPIFPRYEVPLLGISDFPSDAAIEAALAAAATRYIAEGLAGDVSEATRTAFQMHRPTVHTGQVLSGDQFIADAATLSRLREAFPRALCVEMEGAAVAQVCYEHEMPFGVIRTISDTADDSAATDFPRFLTEIASIFAHGIVQAFLASDSR
jgi:adenosylhomocysteine nucleosidase